MRIRSIQATNLLSFESFELDLQPGLNVIVGPNGAGKSNLVRLLRLVRAALDITIRASDASIDVRQHLRLGMPTPRSGAVSLHIELTEPREKRLMIAYVRALVSAAIDRPPNESPTHESPFEQSLAAKVRSLVGDQVVAPLFAGRLVLGLTDDSLAGIAFAYEFDVDDAAYHIGLYGSGVPAGWVAAGPAVLVSRSGWGGQQLDLTQVLTDERDLTKFALHQLLPRDDKPMVWDVKTHPTGQRLPLAQELARDLAATPDPSRTLPFGLVLYRALEGALTFTSNLRRPPRFDYALTEVGPPVSIDDGGDLPLELYRLAVGELEERRSYDIVRDRFRKLTGLRLDLNVRMKPSPEQPNSYALRIVNQASVGASPFLGVEPVTSPPSYQMRIVPVVVSDAGEVPIDFAGAGVWEALVSSAVAVPAAGRVVVLDEPAVNLHPTWQRRLLGQLASLDQTLLITHSPYLVPAGSLDDLARTVRLYQGSAGTACARLPCNPPEGWRERWRQILAGSTEARSALFARGVVLVEGDTDSGAFRHWFSDRLVTRSPERSADGLDVLILPVNSDKSFGAYASLLDAFAVRWVIISDGPVLSPERETSLIDQLEDLVELAGRPETDKFADWKTYWRMRGVFTVADQFGGVNDDKDKSGEIEAFFKRTDPDLWEGIGLRHLKSKVRQGYAFADELDLATHPEALNELRTIWGAAVERLVGRRVRAGRPAR